MRLCGLLVALASTVGLALPSVAAAELPTIFGVRLGAPINLPDCAEGSRQTTACIERGLIPTLARLEIPNQPLYAKDISLGLHGAEVVAVAISTGGLDDQMPAYEALSAKFGPPNNFRYVTRQNSFGAKYDSIVAHWEKSGFRVDFVGLTNRPTSGLIQVIGCLYNACLAKSPDAPM